MMKLLQYFLCLLLIGMSCQSVQAHRLDATETSISFNPRSQHIEVIHKFYLHDMNHLIQQHFVANSNADKTNKNAPFIEYILSSVELNFDSVTVPLTYIGAEEEGKFFYIYQELKLKSTEGIKFVEIDTRKMQNSWKPSHWLFSIELKDDTLKTFVLDKRDYEYRAQL